jgi:hypothetical protein
MTTAGPNRLRNAIRHPPVAAAIALSEGPPRSPIRPYAGQRAPDP